MNYESVYPVGVPDIELIQAFFSRTYAYSVIQGLICGNGILF